MVTSEPDERVMASFLTGAMAPEEKQRFEERLASEPELFEAVAAYEDDLILSFVKGELREDDARRFKKVYRAQPARWRRVEETRSLVRALQPPKRSLAVAFADFFSTQSGMARTALASAALVCLAWMGLATWDIFRLRDQLEQQRSPATELPQVAVVYTPPAEEQRGPGGPPAPLRVAGAAWVILRIDSVNPGPVAAYRAALRPLEGVEREYASGLDVTTSQRGTTVELAVPAREMPPGDYIVRVEGQTSKGGWKEIAARAFRVAP